MPAGQLAASAAFSQLHGRQGALQALPHLHEELHAVTVPVAGVHACWQRNDGLLPVAVLAARLGPAGAVVHGRSLPGRRKRLQAAGPGGWAVQAGHVSWRRLPSITPQLNWPAIQPNAKTGHTAVSPYLSSSCSKHEYGAEQAGIHMGLGFQTSCAALPRVLSTQGCQLTLPSLNTLYMSVHRRQPVA